MFKRLMLLLGAVTLAAAFGGSASAMRSDWSNVSYYSDATYTTVVGTEFFPCNGPSRLNGTRTPYELTISEGSCTPSPGEPCPNPFGC